MRRLVALALLAFAVVANAQGLQQLADPNRTVVFSTAQGAAPAGSGWVLAANPFGGPESTWFTDGTEAGTRFLYNFPSVASSRYVSFGGQVYFLTASGGAYQLVRTNGNSLPPTSTAVTDVTLPSMTDPALVVAGPNLFITSSTAIIATNGTAAGTTQVTPAGLAISQVVPFGSKLLFVGTRNAEGSELWVTDGTVAGTGVVKDILPGSAGSNPTGLGVGGGKAYFWAIDDPFSSRKLWATDGTAAGTTKVSDTLSPPSFSAFLDFNGYAYFSVSGSGSTTLMRTDGTAAGTIAVKDGIFLDSSVVVLGNVFYQVTANGLLRFDGTNAGTTTTAYSGNYFSNLFVFGGKLYFTGSVPNADVSHVIRVDGTDTGALTFVDTGISSDLGAQLVLGSLLLTKVTVPGINVPRINAAAWIGDGTAANTRVWRFAPGFTPSSASCDDSNYANLGTVVLFTANDGEHGCELWRTDGRPAGTFMLKDVTPGVPNGIRNTGAFVVWNGIAYFDTDDYPYTNGLWRSDGTPEGTVRLNSLQTELPVSIGPALFFLSNDCGYATHNTCPNLWSTDGTAPGTTAVTFVGNDGFGGRAWNLVSLGNKGYFAGYGPDKYFNGQVIYVTDGTAGGTQVAQSFPGASNIQLFAAATRAFAWITVGTNVTLYRIDASSNAIVPLATMPSTNLQNAQVGVFGDSFFYSAIDATDGGSAAWVVNGNNAPAKLALGASPKGAATTDGLYFVAGNALYRSRGTDITFLGNMNSFASPLVVGRAVYFHGQAGYPGTYSGVWRADPYQVRFLSDIGNSRGPFERLSNGLFLFATFNADLTPAVLSAGADPLTFPDATNVSYGVTVTSSPALVDGLLTAPKTATATSGQVCVSSTSSCSCDVSGFSASAPVSNGQYVCLRHTSASTPSSVTLTELSLDGQIASFRSITAPTQTLSVSTTGVGFGKVVSFGPGIDCGPLCAMSVQHGTTVSVAAVQALGSAFRGWLGACNHPAVVCTLTMDANYNVVAQFGRSVRRGLAGDLNGDGFADMLWRDAGGNPSTWLMHLNATHDSLALTPPATGAVIVNKGDFDGDGKTDLLWRTPTGAYWITLQDGATTLASKKLLDGGSGWEVVEKGDFDGDGKTDLLWRGPAGDHRVALMNGTSDPAYPQIVAAGAGLSVALVADFDGDGKSDIVWTGADGSATMFLMNGAAIAKQQLLLGGGTGWTPIAFGDLNGDGMADIVWRHTDGRIGEWFMNGTNAWSYGSLVGAGTGWTVKLVRDLDGDGKSDLLWQHDDGSWAAWLMDGGTPKGYAGLRGPGNGQQLVASEDYDGDGRDDLLWRAGDGSYSVWLMAGLSVKAFIGLTTAGSGLEMAP